MASGHGIAYHQSIDTYHHEHVPTTDHPIYRQIYWARYVD
jgi:bacteriorhodopsin